MPPGGLWEWLTQQGATVVVLFLGAWAMAVKGVAVPGYAYRRELERADRLEALLLRSLHTTERTATIAEKVVNASLPGQASD